MALKNKTIQLAYKRKKPRPTPVGTVSLTKQSFTDECDINSIMRKFQKTGALTHVSNHAENYGFATSEDFSSSMQLVAQATTMFEELPSSIRKQFNNEPGQFLDFVQDPANLEEMREMGLANQYSTNGEIPLTQPAQVQDKTKAQDVPPESVQKSSKDATISNE